jgi:hypothetical protein
MDPTTVLAAIRTTAALRRALDTSALRRQVEGIRSAVDTIGKQLAENILVEVDTGFSHLAVALDAGDELRRDELGYARTYFARLANRPGGGVVAGRYTELTGDEVRALGHYGNFYYFLLRDEPRQALISAYRCTEQLPVLGVLRLPVELFSRDYRSAVEPYERRRQALEGTYRLAKAAHEHDRRKFREMAWRVPAAGGAIIGGLLAGAVSPPLAGRGVAVAGQILGRAEQVLPPSKPSGQALVAHLHEMETLLAPVVAEARQRRLAVEASPAR